MEIALYLLRYGVILGITLGFVLALVLASERISALERARPGSAGMFGDVVPLAYPLVIPLWYVSLPLALYWLYRRPDLARQARITLVFLGAYWAVAWWLPETSDLLVWVSSWLYWWITS